MRTLVLTGSLIAGLGIQALAADAGAGVPAVAVVAEPAPAPIYRAAKPVTIDGKLDEPCWQQATVFRADYRQDKQGELDTTPHLSVRYAWDDHYLYLAYETFDANLTAQASGETQGPAKNRREGAALCHGDLMFDLVEFFISMGDPRFFWEIHQNPLNQFNDVWCTYVDPSWSIYKAAFCPWEIIFCDGEYLRDEGDYTVQRAVWLKPKANGAKSTVNKSKDVDTGYTAEIRIPWLPLGGAADRRVWEKDERGYNKRVIGWNMAGQELRILAVYQDEDSKQRYFHSSPTRKGDWFHKTFAHWPRLLLSAEPPVAALAERNSEVLVDVRRERR